MLKGRNAVVTGGGRGIGAAVARALVEAGARVVVSARSEVEIEATAASLREDGGEAWAVAADVSRPEAVRRLFEESTGHLGQIDILVNNAGFASSSRLTKIRLEDWERLFAVNVTGTFLCTQAFLPPMAERGWGRVVNVASIAGRMGAPYISAYVASKHAVVGFTRAVAMEYAATGVTVNAVGPGYVDTALVDRAVANIAEKAGMEEEAARETLRSQSPQGRIYTPEEVAFLVVTLCDERAGGINAQCLVLDGGSVQA
jgi:NAD(P)-dependent dehydrogenase (short-subunit alcohol dehydrogenase family)